MEVSKKPENLRAEVINHELPTRKIKVAMIDFDGTLSLLREGWDQVMIPMMVEELLPLQGTSETLNDLNAKVTEWVFKLNGQPTIMQMQALVDEVALRQGTPATASQYKQRYLKRLLATVNQRKQQIQATQQADTWMVPGSRELLNQLKLRQIPMLLASGTDLRDLHSESELLGLVEYFTEGIAGPESDASSFSKAKACDEMLTRQQAPGSSLLNIGDGYVETRLSKERGGLAIGIAYDHDKPGLYNPWRKEQLLRAGVDILVPDLQQSELLLHWLLDGVAS